MNVFECIHEAFKQETSRVMTIGLFKTKQPAALLKSLSRIGNDGESVLGSHFNSESVGLLPTLSRYIQHLHLFLDIGLERKRKRMFGAGDPFPESG